MKKPEMKQYRDNKFYHRYVLTPLQVSLVKAQGGEATFVRADVSKEKDNEEMVKAAVKTYGKLNILFNNAGLSPRAEPMA